VEANFPKTEAISSAERALSDPKVNGIIIATPAGTHFELARETLLAGKHVFVEKPLATKVTEVDELGRLAAKRDLLVMAGHTFVYNAAVRYIKKLLDAGEVGEIRYIYSQRLNLGRIRSDIDALWNFAPHDVSIIQYWLGDPSPVSVHRIGMDFIQNGIDDVVFLSLVYPKKIIANIHVSWLDPQKVRKIIIVGSRKMIVFDDVAEDKVTIYDKGIDRKAILGEHMDFDEPNADQFNYRTGDSIIPQIHFTEPLRAAAESFVESMWNGKKSVTGIAHARNVVAILEQAQRV
jgi:predicted dehydrogenase